MMHLLKKELSELMNTQFLLSLLVTFILITAVGLIMTNTLSDSMNTGGEVHLIDNDRTEFTAELVQTMEEEGYKVLCRSGEDPMEILENQNWTEAAVLPEGFSDTLLNRREQAQLESLTVLKSTSSIQLSLSQGISAQAVKDTVQTLLMKEVCGEDEAFLTSPVKEVPYTIANNKAAQANSMAVVSSMALFDQLMPLVLFLLVILTSQTIITAIGAEKTDKTLETLLSSPAPRLSILEAKLLAALIVAVIYALSCGAGFLITLLLNVERGAQSVDLGAALGSLARTGQAVETLELGIGGLGWTLVILQLVLTIAITLVASLILGAMVQDIKGAQTASLPILLCTMFPYLLSMVSDIRQMGLPARGILYLIPFTHTFIATGCLRFHDYGTLAGGFIYQAVFLAVMVCLALRVYKSDILFTRQSLWQKKQK